jgi:hypothetical protein
MKDSPSTTQTTGSGPHPSLSAGSWRSRLWPLFRQRLLHSDLPILVGPWLSEVGFEALYWLPFIERLVKDGVSRDRLIPISRGGASVWYGTERGLEIYAMRSVQDVRVEMRLRATNAFESVKQLTWTPFERQIVKDAAETLGLTKYFVLHPRWMYHVLASYWEAERGLVWLQNHTHWAPIQPPPLPGATQLPEQFVAVRFYRRSTLSQDALPMIRACIQQLAQEVPVILLSSEFRADDHRDMEVTGPNIYHLRDLAPLNPETNLAVQSAVLARALAFVGTYGGFAQLALRLGKPSVTFYDTWAGTMITHKHLADALSVQLGVTWAVLGVRDFPLIQSAMPLIHVSTPQQSMPTEVLQPTG